MNDKDVRAAFQILVDKWCVMSMVCNRVGSGCIFLMVSLRLPSNGLNQLEDCCRPKNSTESLSIIKCTHSKTVVPISSFRDDRRRSSTNGMHLPVAASCDI